VSAQNGQIRRGISPHHDSRDATAVNEGNTRLRHTLHYMLVRQHIAVRRDDEARACAPSGATLVVEAANVDAHDSRAHVLY
jgi:hypothetical protein